MYIINYKSWSFLFSLELSDGDFEPGTADTYDDEETIAEEEEHDNSVRMYLIECEVVRDLQNEC